MKQFSLTEIITKDKLIHQGIFFEPTKPSRKAILWVHGLTGSFYGGVALINELAQMCDKEGIGFASFNNRGHDMITGLKKINKDSKKGYDYVTAGAGLEHFEECMYDIQAGIDFLDKQGFTEIILAGHSTGANKVCYWAGTQKDSRVTGIILACPMSDRLGTKEEDDIRKENIKEMQQFIKEGADHEIMVGYHFFPITPERYLSLFEPGSPEDVFSYGDKKPSMKTYANITKPMLVVFADEDEGADRPIPEIKKAFDNQTKSNKYKSIVISGASHSFIKKEREVAKETGTWVSSI